MSRSRLLTAIRWRRPDANGVSLLKKIIITGSLVSIVMIAFTAVGIFHVYGPVIERNRVQECSTLERRRHIPQQRKPSIETITNIILDSNLPFCHKAWDYVVHTIQAFLINVEQTSRFESTQVCHQDDDDLQDSSHPPPLSTTTPSKHPIQKLLQRFLNRKSVRSKTSSASSSSLEEFVNAYPRPIVLTEPNRALMRELSHRVKKNIPKFSTRAAHVAWGGPGGPKWYYPTAGEQHFPTFTTATTAATTTDIDAMEGGRLLYAY